jgi:hypothetical protein
MPSPGHDALDILDRLDRRRDHHADPTFRKGGLERIGALDVAGTAQPLEGFE